jgi:ABC-2 type transport system permease protein
MTARILAATVGRVLTQLRHDPRTIAMMLAVPIGLMTLVYFIFEGRGHLRSGVILVVLGIFPFVVMFLVTSIAMLRERTSGTLERLMTTPTSKMDLLVGYGLSFGIAAVVQGTLAAACAYWLLGVTTAGSAGLVVVITVLTAILGAGLGLVCSALARTEFQAVQMMPVVVFPQALLCGLFVARGDMATWLQALSDVMPLSYVVQALREVAAHQVPTGLLWRDIGVLAGCIIVSLVIAAATLSRRTR